MATARKEADLAPDRQDGPFPPSVSTTSSPKAKSQTSRELFACTISKPPHAYALLELVAEGPGGPAELDALQVRSFCTAALTQFLGATGAAIHIDILKVQDAECWVRVPREDLAPFAAAITAWPGVSRDGSTSILQLRAAGNWLGSLLGRNEQREIWAS